MFALFTFYTIMAGVFTFGKQVICYASPLFLTAIRIAPGGIVFLGYLYLRNRKEFVFKRSYMPLITGYAIAVFCMDALRMLALQYIPASNAALISCTAPFIAAFFSWCFMNERFDKIKIVALIFGVLGMMPLLMEHVTLAHAVDTKIVIICYLGAFASTICTVLCGIFSKTLIQKKGCPFLLCLGSGMFGGGLLGFISSLLFETWNPVPISHLLPALQLISFLFATHTLIAYPLYNYLILKYSVTLVAFGQLSVPFIAAILGYLFYGQPIGLNFFISLLILSASFWLFYKEELYLLSKKRK
jgi:drug/metabolite transporter (DMT)-like permease